MPNNETFQSLINAYSTNKPVTTEQQPSFEYGTGVPYSEYKAIVDSGKSWFSEDLTFNLGDKEAVFYRTPEQLKSEQEYYQSVPEKLTAGVLRATNKFASEILKMPGYVGGLTQAAFTDKSLGESLDNFWVNGLQEWENYVNNDVLKVYTPDSVKNGTLWDNLSSASFWATEGADGIGFLASMLVPGNALKLLKLGQRGVNLYNAGNAFLRTSKGLAKGLTKTQALKFAAQGEKLGMAAARNIDDFTAAGVNAVLEGSAEAKESFDSSLNEQIANYMDQNGLQDPSQIDQETMQSFRNTAGEIASNVFKFNSVLLLGPNLLDQMNLFGAFNSRRTGLAKLFSEKGVLQDFTKQTLKEKALGYLGKGAIGLGKEGFFEEGLQFAGAEYFKKQGLLSEEEKDKGFKDIISGLATEYVDQLDSLDMQKSIALGGILGGGMSMVGKYRTDKYESKYGKELHAQLQNNLIDRIKGVTDIFEKDPETGKIIYDSNTKQPKINDAKFQELLTQPESKMTLSKLADIAAISGNKEDYKLFQSVLDFNYFTPFFQQGDQGIQILKNHITGQLSESEEGKQEVEELLGISGFSSANQRISDLMLKVDEYYKIYNSIDDRHQFDMPNLKGGNKKDKAEFAELIRNKKLEKGILTNELSKISNDLNTKVFAIVSKNLVSETDPTEPIELSEADKKELELLYGKEKQYKELLKSLQEDEKALYDNNSIQEEYQKQLASKLAKKEEDAIAEATDEQVKDKFAKDLADAGYVMDREHMLDPEAKAKLSPEELEKYKGQDRSFYFELNGKDYEAYSLKDTQTGQVKRVYRDADSKQVIGEFNTDFLRKNRGVRIVNKEEALAKRKLEKLRKSKYAKLRAFRTVYDKLNADIANNKGILQDAVNRRVEIKNQIEFYEDWIKQISNEYGRANNGKAQEKKQLLDEIKRLEGLLTEVDSQIVELNTIYDSLSEQLGLLFNIKEQFEIFRQDGMFKTEMPDIELNQFTQAVKNEINRELESLIEEEKDLDESLQKANEAVQVAERNLRNAEDLRTELEIIYEDLTRVKDINEIIESLLTADLNSDKLRILAARYKPLRLIFNSIEKLRNNSITDEEYLKVIQIANNLLTDQYLQFGTENLSDLTDRIKRAAKESTQIPLNPEVQFYVENHYFYPDRMIARIINNRRNLLDSATKYYFDLSEKRLAEISTRDLKALRLSEKENDLNRVMNELYVQYRKEFSKSTGKITFNNEAPTAYLQPPTVYDDDTPKVNPNSFLTNEVFRNIGMDLMVKDGLTVYPDDNEGLPQLNENDENYRRLRTFMDNNPDLATKYNARFFIARTDENGEVSMSLGNGQSSSELLALYKAIPESGRPPGDLSIGFYLEDSTGKPAIETYNNETKLVVGFIPRKITDDNGNLRINNAAAVSILVPGFDIKGKVKFINDYQFNKEGDEYTFTAENNNKPVDVKVTIKDGKASISTRFDAFIQGESELKIDEEQAIGIAQLLKENSEYSLSRAGKEIQNILKNSKVKYHQYVNLQRVITKLIEDPIVFNRYKAITIDDLIQKAKDALAGDNGLYKTQVIDYLVDHIETNDKRAYSKVNYITTGIPIIQYQTDENGKPMFNKPVENTVSQVYPIKFDKGKMQGGDIMIADFTNPTTFTPGKVLLKLDKTGETVKLNQRNLTSDEILTAMYIMSTADEGNTLAPNFGEKKFMRIKDGDNSKSISSYFMLPFNKNNTVSAITSLLYWGKQNDETYINEQGEEVPLSSNKVSEIYYSGGQIFFKKKMDTGTWVQTSINIMAIKEAFNSPNPLQNPLVQELVTYLSDKKLNVNKQLLTANSESGIYFHPKLVKSEKGYELQYDSYDSYRYFLLKSANKVLTSSSPIKENFPKFANKMLVFNRVGTDNSIGIQVTENYAKPSERVKAEPVFTKNKTTKTSKEEKVIVTKSGLDASKLNEESKKILKGATLATKYNKTPFKDLPDGTYTIEETEYDTDGKSIKNRVINTFVKKNGKYETSSLSNSYSQDELAIFEDVRDMSLKSFIGENKNFTFLEYKPLSNSKEEEIADDVVEGLSLLEQARKTLEEQKKQAPTAPVSDSDKTPIEGLNERLNAYGNANVILSDDFNEGARPKGRLNAFKSAIITIADNLIALADVNLNEFNFLTEEDKKRLDALRPLAKELNKINTNDISSADRRTVAIEKRYAQLTNQLANEFVDIVGKHVEQQLGKKITSSKLKLTALEQQPTTTRTSRVSGATRGSADNINEVIKRNQQDKNCK